MSNKPDREALRLLRHWVRERYRILERKEAGRPRPWTKDPILAEYRFCNVFREDDSVTRWVHTYWLQRRGTKREADMWFAMAVARLLNLPSTLRVLGWPLPWNESDFLQALGDHRAAGNKVFNGAYIVSTNGHKMDKLEYLATKVLTPLWQSRGIIAPRKGDTLADFHARLVQHDGMGSFMAAQVIADVKHHRTGPLYNAPDWYTWAASGPGSRRGLNRVYGRDIKAPWREGEWLAALAPVHADLKTVVHKTTKGQRVLDAQNFQNCLCEFDKYMRAHLGEGKPKAKYTPADVPW